MFRSSSNSGTSTLMFGIVVLLVVGMTGFVNKSVSATQATFDGGSFTWPASPGPGHLGLYIDDSVSHTRKVSVLGNLSTGALCTSPSDERCAGASARVYAIIPPCSANVQIDCIESVGSSSKSGVVDSGVFSRQFPEKGLGDFAGDPNLKVPTGSSPSIWSLPKTPHIGGNDYIVVVSITGTSPVARNGLTSPELSAAIYPVSIVTGGFARNVPTSIGGISHPSSSPWSNCASVADGACASRQPFPTDTAFSLSLKLSTAPTGWLHGRIFAPSIAYTTSDGVTRLKVDATPTLVPAVATWTKVDTLPASITGSLPRGVSCSTFIQCGQLNPQAAGAHTAVENWRSFYGDKASWVRSHWNFSTLNAENGPALSGVSGEITGRCLADRTVLHGFVTTNATGYVGGPPAFSADDKSFTYTVSSPHFSERDVVIRGTYSLVMRSETARCFYGTNEGRLTANVSVIQQDGTNQSSSTVVNVSDDGSWLRIFASGFHYSSPKLTARLVPGTGQGAASTEWSWPAGGGNFETLPVVASAPVLSPDTKSLAVRTKVGRTLTAKSLAKTAKLKVTSKSRLALTITRSSQSRCRVIGTSIRATKKGQCRVTVTVRTGSKKTSKTVAVTIS